MVQKDNREKSKRAKFVLSKHQYNWKTLPELMKEKQGRNITNMRNERNNYRKHKY